MRRMGCMFAPNVRNRPLDAARSIIKSNEELAQPAWTGPLPRYLTEIIGRRQRSRA
jgi:hypothetical protein